MSVPDNLCVTGSVEGGIQQPVELNVSRLNAAYIGLGKIQKSLAFQLAVAGSDIDSPLRPDQRAVRTGQGHRVEYHLQCAGFGKFAFQIDRCPDVAGACGQQDAALGNLHWRQRTATVPARPAQIFKPMKANTTIIQRAVQFRRNNRYGTERRHQPLPGYVCSYFVCHEGRLVAGFDAHPGNHRATRPKALEIGLASQELVMAPLRQCLLGDVFATEPAECTKKQDQGQDRDQQPTPPIQAARARLRAFNL